MTVHFKRDHYERHEQLRSHLQLFVEAYNHGRRLETLRGLTPYEYAGEIWPEEPDRFRTNPPRHISGPQLDAKSANASESRSLSRSSGTRSVFSFAFGART